MSLLHITTHKLKIPNVVRGEGLVVTDDAGKEYLDMESGVWCLSLGHNNGDVNAAMVSQMRKIVHCGFNFSSANVERSAGMLCDKVGFEKGGAVFLCSGSEGVELCSQMAKHLTGNSRLMTLHDSYLGSYSSLKDRADNWHLFDWTDCAACADPKECSASCEKIQQIPADIGAFIFEPGSSSGFVRFPPASLISTLALAVKDRGGYVIVNEVTTGVGRTGNWFGFQHYDVQPDFVAVGKGIGNGYPVSAAVMSEAVCDALKKRPFTYAQSHQNDALGAAVVASVIDYIDRHQLISNARTMGQRLLGALTRLVDGDRITAVRGRGLMIAIDLKSAEITEQFHNALIDHGVLVGNRGTALRIDPPLTIDSDTVEKVLDIFSIVVAELAEE